MNPTCVVSHYLRDSLCITRTCTSSTVNTDARTQCLPRPIRRRGCPGTETQICCCSAHGAQNRYILSSTAATLRLGSLKDGLECRPCVTVSVTESLQCTTYRRRCRTFLHRSTEPVPGATNPSFKQVIGPNPVQIIVTQHSTFRNS